MALSPSSFIRYEDFAKHSAEWVEPVSTSYRGHEVWELPPNGQGIAALQILNVLEGYDLAAMGFGSLDYVHTFIEAKKLAYEDRARLYGDPAFTELPIRRLLSKEYAAERRALIDPSRAAREFPVDPSFLRKGDTIYLCTADEAGNMVSLIQSNYAGMGSGVCPPGLGFGFQNRGTAFTFEKGHPNVYAPEVVRDLQLRGHRLRQFVGPYGGYQAIRRGPQGTYYGASESRKDGQAAGY